MSLDLSPDDLEILAKRVAVHLAAQLRPVSLLTKSELAEQFRCAPAQIDRLVRKGMPRRFVGDRSRFEIAECLAWCQSRQELKTAPSSDEYTLVQPKRRSA